MVATRTSETRCKVISPPLRILGLVTATALYTVRLYKGPALRRVSRQSRNVQDLRKEVLGVSGLSEHSRPGYRKEWTNDRVRAMTICMTRAPLLFFTFLVSRLVFS